MKDLIVIRILMLFSAFWMPLAVNILIDEKIKWQKRLIDGKDLCSLTICIIIKL